MRRIQTLSRHLVAAKEDEDDEEEELYHLASAHQGPLPAVPPVVKATKQLSTDPIGFLQARLGHAPAGTPQDSDLSRFGNDSCI